ncbi:type IV toxin-antitoxin system AbiEi family antitoxin domain-containing protein [Oligoflexus tunisiensis]|uniref:type IV toxin-antitoxin system AbiEi family antitoxin domain-containing protein n=1 Tax=Oligoflexus tunisiensis TaxID=708132 RepID=UPI00114D07E1|nr:type IV toxin-antitoxin system AbiEi family antitoxin domain-containing protein [Oligoflexus tunisiensis]
MTAKDKILERSIESGGFITAAEIAQLGIAYGSIRHLVETGTLKKVATGLYRMTLVPSGEHEDYHMMSSFFKKPNGGYYGIIGAISALDIMGITELMPSSLQFVVEANYKTEKKPPLTFETYKLDSQITEGQIHFHNGLPLQRAADAIAISLKYHLGQMTLLKNTFEKALDIGLIKASEEVKIRKLFTSLENSD